MWPLLERVIEVWCCRMPYTVCLAGCSGWFLAVWTRATVLQPRCLLSRGGAGAGKEEKTVSICKPETSWGCFSWRIKFAGQKTNIEHLQSLCGICTEFEFDKVQNPLHFEDWLTSYPWMDLNGNIIYHPVLPPACWCSVNKRKIIKM